MKGKGKGKGKGRYDSLFTRQELQEIRLRAYYGAEKPAIPDNFDSLAKAYRRLQDAADLLDAALARCEANETQYMDIDSPSTLFWQAVPGQSQDYKGHSQREVRDDESD